MFRRNVLLVTAFVATFAPSCERDDTPTVVVYTALDRAFSEPIFEEFTRKTGIRVLAQYDPESTKTVGLATRIRREKNRPRCDVFWNNEILNTLNLQREGLLESCRPENAGDYPPEYRDPDGHWYGFAARARVLIVNTDRVAEEDFPRSIHDLADPRWKGETGIAKPLFGTTASHVACLFAALGSAEASTYLESIDQNEVVIHGGNKGSAVAVARGQNAFALTDTDDAMIEKEAGHPVAIVYPDSSEDAIGTLFLPNTLAMLRGAPHPEEALALITYLLSPEVEEKLAAGPSAQIPLNRKSKPNPRVKGPREVKAMEVDFDEAAAAFDEARQVVEALLLD